MLKAIFESDTGIRCRTIERNRLLIELQSCDQHIYYFRSGSAALLTEIAGREQIIRLAYPGSLLFAPDSFFKNSATRYFARALKRCEVLYIHKSDLHEQFASAPEKLNGLYEQMILELCERELDILEPCAAQRYQNLLKRSAQIFQHIPHKHIASYLRISPETLSRLKKP